MLTFIAENKTFVHEHHEELQDNRANKQKTSCRAIRKRLSL